MPLNHELSSLVIYFFFVDFRFWLFLGGLQRMDSRWYSGKQEMHMRRQQKDDEVNFTDLHIFSLSMCSIWM